MEKLLNLPPLITETNKKYAYVVILFGGDGYLPRIDGGLLFEEFW